MPAASVRVVAISYAFLLLLTFRQTEGCDSSKVRGRSVTAWPTQNPALVAPVTVLYNNVPYRAPLEAQLTADNGAISIDVPPDFIAGFTLKGGTADEKFGLKRVEIRRAGKVPSGTSRVLDHVLEAAFLHQQVNGSNWASVVVPFDVTSDPQLDILTPLVSGAALPSKDKDVKPVLVNGLQAFDVDPVYHGALFHSYRTKLPTDCDNTTVDGLRLMRSTSLFTGEDTFKSLLAALHEVPEAAPLDSPEGTFLTAACPADASDACKAPTPAVLADMMLTAKKTQSAAVKNIRAQKAVMDKILDDLSKGNSSYSVAENAKLKLRAAQVQLDSSIHQVQQLGHWTEQAKTAKWVSAPAKAQLNAWTAEAEKAHPLSQMRQLVAQAASKHTFGIHTQ